MLYLKEGSSSEAAHDHFQQSFSDESCITVINETFTGQDRALVVCLLQFMVDIFWGHLKSVQ